MIGRPLDQADAAMAEVQQVVGDDPGPALVVDLDDGSMLAGGGRGDAHVRNRRLVQGVQHHGVVARRGQQDDTVDRQAMDQGLHVGGQIRRGEVDWLDHQVKAALVAGPQRPQLGMYGIGADGAQQEADLIGA